ncbi:MAG: AAA family ATPase [Candidatus Pacebacteria bacterium]|nr:AAA family ATPase [Candidatus Paceibacterota bacterium]MBP9772465.1 AAA family ATPase [Candidatus Paceibacterota bacterium]
MTQREALNILKTGASVFLTGEPGAGKSYVIREYVDYLHEHGIEPAITASTGIAATHIHGQTIHSWSGIGIKDFLSPYDLEALSEKEYLVKRLKNTTTLIIDEISMLSSSTLDCVDKVCRKLRDTDEPFGGVQVVLVGDFFQLPPISNANSLKDFAYNSKAWTALAPVVCYLSEQHRQEDPELLSLLSAIRRNEVEEMHFEYIQSRINTGEQISESITRLFTKNVSVDALNSQSLGKLTGMDHKYNMDSKGKASMVEALKKGCLSPEVLVLKKDSVVMFTKNNPQAGFANGTLGKVVDFDSLSHYPIVLTRGGRRITVEPAEWVIEEDGKVRARISQLPLRLAWAITVHKSQGMSLDAAVMDLRDVFEYGQGYVALSRVRTLAGIYLHGINQKSLQVHPGVLETDESFRNKSTDAAYYFESLDSSAIKIMHDNFIKACGGSVEKLAADKISKKTKDKTEEKTLALLEEGCSIEDIKERRGFTEGTIIDHIANLVKNGKFEKDRVRELCSKDLLDCLPSIFKAFKTEGFEKLAPVHAYLKGSYTYEELKLARILYQ